MSDDLDREDWDSVHSRFKARTDVSQARVRRIVGKVTACGVTMSEEELGKFLHDAQRDYVVDRTAFYFRSPNGRPPRPEDDPIPPGEGFENFDWQDAFGRMRGKPENEPMVRLFWDCSLFWERDPERGKFRPVCEEIDESVRPTLRPEIAGMFFVEVATALGAEQGYEGYEVQKSVVQQCRSAANRAHELRYRNPRA